MVIWNSKEVVEKLFFTPKSYKLPITNEVNIILKIHLIQSLFGNKNNK